MQTLAQISQQMEQLGMPPTQGGVPLLPGKGNRNCPAAQEAGTSSDTEEKNEEHGSSKKRQGAKRQMAKRVACYRVFREQF